MPGDEEACNFRARDAYGLYILSNVGKGYDGLRDGSTLTLEPFWFPPN